MKAKCYCGKKAYLYGMCRACLDRADQERSGMVEPIEDTPSLYDPMSYER
jgi:hypothetical protein